MSRDLLPISLVAHTVFCPRRAWLEAVGETVDHVNIDAGVAAHKRVDARSGERDAQRRSVEVVDDSLGVRGKCDVVEGGPSGVRVTEFKTAPGRRSFTVTEAQRVQLALQGLCLRSMGHDVSSYAVHFVTSNRTVPVELVSDDFEVARRYVHETRTIVESKAAPPPLHDDPRCGRCSHAGVCLPDERDVIREERGQARVLARDPDASVLHLTTPGSRASLTAGRVKVVRGEETLASVPLERVGGLVVHGNVDVSSALIRELLWRKSPLVWASGRGSVIGYARSARGPGGEQRVQQHLMSVKGNLPVASEMISCKIANQATMLRRGAGVAAAPVVQHLRHLQRAAKGCASRLDLFGVEGEAASLYFRWFPEMLTAGEWVVASWPGRRGRGALDPLNVAFNLVYGLLVADVTRAVVATGLDPHAGFLHSSNRNKPALVLDLMEEFRPVLADSAVVTALNNGELRPEMFTNVLGEWRLRDQGRRALVAAYERRVAQEFKHPTFGYRVTWRRAMEVQARLVLGVVDGTQGIYRGIRVR